MSVNFSALIEEVNQITEKLKKPKQTVPLILLDLFLNTLIRCEK